MEYKVGDKTQIYCVTQEWVDGNDSEVFVMACFRITCYLDWS